MRIFLVKKSPVFLTNFHFNCLNKSLLIYVASQKFVIKIDFNLNISINLFRFVWHWTMQIYNKKIRRFSIKLLKNLHSPRIFSYFFTFMIFNKKKSHDFLFRFWINFSWFIILYKSRKKNYINQKEKRIK